MVQQIVEDFQFEAALLVERPRLVRLCAHISGNRDAAEVINIHETSL